jgi:hypothetical protein
MEGKRRDERREGRKKQEKQGKADSAFCPLPLCGSWFFCPSSFLFLFSSHYTRLVFQITPRATTAHATCSSRNRRRCHHHRAAKLPRRRFLPCCPATSGTAKPLVAVFPAGDVMATPSELLRGRISNRLSELVRAVDVLAADIQRWNRADLPRDMSPVPMMVAFGILSQLAADLVAGRCSR